MKGFGATVESQPRARPLAAGAAGLVVALFSFLSPIALADGQGDLTQLKFKLEVALEEMAKPLDQLDQQYRKQLEELETEFRKAGNLEFILLIRNEFEKPGGKAATEPPELMRIQRIYLAERNKRSAALSSAKVSTYQKYAAGLRGLKKSLTQAGHIEGAVEVDAELKRADTIVTEAKAAAAKASRPAGSMFSSGPKHLVIVDEHKGSAGHLPSNNTYTFVVEESALPIKKAHIVYYASASKSTNGKIYFWRGKGDRKEIGEWKSSDSELMAKAREAGEKFHGGFFGRTIDLGRQVSKPGEYTIKFSYKTGESSLSISRVELHLNPPKTDGR